MCCVRDTRELTDVLLLDDPRSAEVSERKSSDFATWWGSLLFVLEMFAMDGCYGTCEGGQA